MILEMFEMFISSTPDMKLTTARDLKEALKHIAEDGPYDIVLLDLNMPGMNGLEGLSVALEANDRKPVAILTGNPTARMAEELLEKGGAGIIVKTASLKSLTSTIRFLASGERHVPLDLLNERNVARDNMATPMSDREFSVLDKLGEGMSNRDIAESLGLSEPTVKMHVQSVCKKLGASNRTQAVMMARDMNLI